MRNQIRQIGLAGATALAFAGGLSGAPAPASACGTAPFLGEICLMPYTFCPRGYTEANGALLSISSFQALFSLLGTTYGGDGRTTFALPDLRGRVAFSLGSGPGQPTYQLGQTGGAATITPTVQHMAAHSHSLSTSTISATGTLHGTTADADATSPAGALVAATRSAAYHVPTSGSSIVEMADGAVTFSGTASGDTGSAGGGTEVENRPAFLVLRYCIALEGTYPSRD